MKSSSKVETIFCGGGFSGWFRRLAKGAKKRIDLNNIYAAVFVAIIL